MLAAELTILHDAIMKLCILCGKTPPIENSHVVSKFVIRWLKDGTPHKTLRFSDDLSRSYQDGWKSDYLCNECELRFSKWEEWFSRVIFKPYLNESKTTFAIPDEALLFAASIHFRCLRRAFDLHPDKQPHPAVDAIYNRLKSICLSGALPPSPVPAYLKFVPMITTQDISWEPGVNTYLRESIDGEIFPWILPGAQIWASYVKLPSMILIWAESDLSAAWKIPGILDSTKMIRNGVIDATAQQKLLLCMMRDTINKRSREIQESYAKFPKKQIEKMLQRINSDPNKKSFRAHETFEADQKLLKHQKGTDLPPEN
jgi:hypothetical protein